MYLSKNNNYIHYPLNCQMCLYPYSAKWLLLLCYVSLACHGKASANTDPGYCHHFRYCWVWRAVVPDASKYPSAFIVTVTENWTSHFKFQLPKSCESFASYGKSGYRNVLARKTKFKSSKMVTIRVLLWHNQWSPVPKWTALRLLFAGTSSL